MKASKICERVRLCFDEEARDDAKFTDAQGDDYPLMNNIIKAKIPDALRWICLFAPADQLSGSSSSAEGSISIVVDATGQVPTTGRISLGSSFIRLIRVRCSNWHRAVSGDTLLSEDSDEYLQLMDDYGATATNDRPQAALIEKATKDVEVWPHVAGATYELTKLVMPDASDMENITDDTEVSIPPLLLTSFLYYIAYLVLTAYQDQRASNMLAIAQMNLGQTDDKQRT